MDSTSNTLELTLSLKPSFVPKPLNHLLTNLAQIDSASAKLSELEIYLNQHEEELRRVQAFDRDLPHCMPLLKGAIEVIQEQISIIKNGSVEADHHTVPLIGKRRNQPEKPSFSSSKHDWMVRPNKWSQTEKMEGTSTNPTPEFNINFDDSTTPIVNNHLPKLPTEISRNGRRIWTPELHLKFMELHLKFMKALNDLGGAEATPKLVRERMRVKGLTNDQVKSHLQKFRIYKKAGLPVPQAGAGSSSAESADNLHQPAMALQKQWTLQSQVPYTYDFFGTASTSSGQYSNWRQHQGDDQGAQN